MTSTRTIMKSDVIESHNAEDFEAVALPHLNDLYRAASHIIGNRTEAEDLVQETYLQAWKSFDRFEPGTNCRAWLFKILFHVTQHHRRKWFRFRLTDDGDEIFEQTLVYEPPVAQDLSDQEVLSAFERIPQRYREVVLLSDVYDFKYKEIQETLGIPAGTVMSRLSRGRQLLRGELANFAETSGRAMFTSARSRARVQSADFSRAMPRDFDASIPKALPD